MGFLLVLLLFPPAQRYVTLHFYFDKTHCWIILLKKDDIYEQQSKIDSYGNFGMQGDMLQRDKENRALRQRRCVKNARLLYLCTNPRLSLRPGI